HHGRREPKPATDHAVVRDPVRRRSIALALGALVSLWVAAGAQEPEVDPLPIAAPVDGTTVTADPPVPDPPDPPPVAGPAHPPAPGPARAASSAAARKPSEKQLITMDFQDVEIGVLVKFISEITGKNFILDEKVRGKVTVISPTKISIEEAYRVFQSILEVK